MNKLIPLQYREIVRAANRHGLKFKKGVQIGNSMCVVAVIAKASGYRPAHTELVCNHTIPTKIVSKLRAIEAGFENNVYYSWEFFRSIYPESTQLEFVRYRNIGERIRKEFLV